MLQAAFGAVGGIIGTLIWKPLPSLNLAPGFRIANRRRPRQKNYSYFAGPLSGAGFFPESHSLLAASCGQCDREFVLEASEGKLRIDTHLQADLVTWEISAVAMLAGSAFAGSIPSTA